MSYFPFFVNVEQLHGVIIGGGKIALEKLERLLDSNGEITLIATNICEEIKRYSDRITLIEREYRAVDLDIADYVIAATNIKELNEQIYSDAKKIKRLINVVDVPDKCDFIFPSVVKRGKLTIGVSTSGAGPQIAIRLRQRIEKIIPDDIEDVLEFLAEERIRAKEEIPDAALRRQYLIELSDRLLKNEER